MPLPTEADFEADLHAFHRKESVLAHEVAAAAANVNFLEESGSKEHVLLAEWRSRLEAARRAYLAHVQPVG